MEMNNGLMALIAALLVCVSVFAGAVGFSKTEVIEVQVPVIRDKLVEVPCPACAVQVCPEVTIPKVESDDNKLLNEFLEDHFGEEYADIEEWAEEYALEELEDHDYRVIVDYLEVLLGEGVELDEDSIDVEIEDIDVEVTAIGLEEDEDKKATVIFEIEVEYELEEGVRDDFEEDLVVTYEVLFEEGDFDDEEVELISII